MGIFTNPTKLCDTCAGPVEQEFVDGKTKHGPWAIMCMECFAVFGTGLGTGRGQHYRKKNDGKFHKISG